MYYRGFSLHQLTTAIMHFQIFSHYITHYAEPIELSGCLVHNMKGGSDVDTNHSTDKQSVSETPAQPCLKESHYLRDGRVLFLEALASGRKVWNYEYRINGKKSQIRLPIDFGSDGGSLKNARVWHDKQRQLVRQGISPTVNARQANARRQAAQQNTFNAVADEWLEHHKDRWSPRHYKKAEGIVRRELRPSLGDRAIACTLLHYQPHSL